MMPVTTISFQFKDLVFNIYVLINHYIFNLDHLFLQGCGMRIRNDLIRIRIFYFWLADPDPTRVLKLNKITKEK